MADPASRGSAVPAPAPVAPFHRLVSKLDPGGSPVARPACGAALEGARRLVALPGSFNPLHRAHMALLEGAATAWAATHAAYVLSVRTVDKEHVSGMLLEDRLWLLCGAVRDDRRPTTNDRRVNNHGVSSSRANRSTHETAVVVTNKGLYFEQAAALHALCPALDELAFVTGYDKIVQIFDPRYYDDRDAALDALFERAAFLVAPRDAATLADLEMLLARPENARYAARVRPLAVGADLARVSSTRVRQGEAWHDVPDAVAAFIRETGCYRSPAPPAYAARAEAIAAAARALP